jgi:hypothetical protein
VALKAEISNTTQIIRKRDEKETIKTKVQLGADKNSAI